MDIRHSLRFLLNGDDVSLDAVTAGQTLLDFLRLDRVKRGTKEGCAEGDCGACTVLVGRLTPEGGLAYEAVNACIRLVGSLDGCHVVTVEHVSRTGAPHPIQQAMVDHHGSQCGFCTPGIVMSLYGLWLSNPAPTATEIERSLQGNLCRCTGYAPILRAALALPGYGDPAQDPLRVEREAIVARLTSLHDGRRVEIGAGPQVIVPADADDLAAVLDAHPEATVVAGATDVGLWVTKAMRDIAPAVFIGHLQDLQHIAFADGAVTFGAGVSYSAARDAIARHVPQMAALWDRIGGDQVRNMGTVGGNIANGSPIGDTPPPFIALGARVTLRKGAARRTLALEDFFIAYGQQDREKGEFVESVTVPLPAADAHFAAYKVTKRREEDISALLGAFNLSLEDGVVSAVRIAFGGMAATPRRARAVEAALLGQPWTEASVAAALPAFAEDFTPLTDWRASADYRMLAARNLLRRFHLETTGHEPVQLSPREVAS